MRVTLQHAQSDVQLACHECEHHHEIGYIDVSTGAGYPEGR
jgi:hypothetical protein